MKVEHGKRHGKPRNPTAAGRDRKNQKGKKLIRNSDVILHFKYRRFSVRKDPGRPFFFQFLFAVLLLAVALSTQMLPSWDFHSSGSSLGQNPNNPVQKNPNNQPKINHNSPQKVGHQVPAHSKLSLMLTNYPIIVFICCWHTRKCNS